ncbi:related to MAK3 N-acetyltransferase [Melanopsichium pennsylvanicum]|uniref:Related to MAK3 N-acetyltransferase n=2 Tax=Melanopsichium pennsylvanicum TaxID=63383 RepID=A0AAJ5C439_9BASI|nr:related to MAK3 N-acetyltransferase [Melanopsichium pennsylvanicum]
MGSIINLIEKELSEPYIVYTYRYFVNQWPNLCFFAYASRSSLTSTPASTTHSSNSSSSTLDSVAKHMNVANISEERERSHSDTHPPRTEQPAGVIVCKQDRHLKGTTRLMRGYIAMISVKTTHRGQGLAKQLVRRAVKEMVKLGAQEVVLETEADNEAALGLYESLGFVREKRLHRFYLNGKDSFRLVLPVPRVSQQAISPEMDLPPPMGLIQPPYPAASQPQRPNFQTDKFSSGSITQ